MEQDHDVSYPCCNEYVFLVLSSLYCNEISLYQSPLFRHRRHTMVLVPLDTPGITKVRALTVFGYNGEYLLVSSLLLYQQVTLSFLKVVLAWKREKTKLARTVGRNEPLAFPSFTTRLRLLIAATLLHF